MQNLQQQELYLHDELNKIYNKKNNMHVVFSFLDYRALVYLS